MTRQWATVVARRTAVLLADRAHLTFLVQPVILGLLPWVAPGYAGLMALRPS